MDLKEYLKENHLTLSRFAQISGLDKGKLSNITNRKIKIGRKIATQIRKATQGCVTMAELLLTPEEIHEFAKNRLISFVAKENKVV